MNTQWNSLLHTHGITTDPGREQRIASPVASDVLLADASPLALVDVTGADAGSFLHSQVINDLLGLPALSAQLNGYCTPKGRLLAVFTVYALGQAGYRLVVPESVVAGFVKRLRMFVMRAAVTITVREDLVCVGLQASNQVDLVERVASIAGAGVEQTLASECSAWSAQTPAWQVRSVGENLDVICWPGASSVATGLPPAAGEQDSGDLPGSAPARLLVIGEVASLADFWAAQAPSATLQNHAGWRLADIAAGLPQVNEHTLEAFVPQMLNLQLINGLSFKKGCYPGQEIVARMHYLGKLKRHMRRFALVCEANGAGDQIVVPKPGSLVAAGDDSNAGIVVDAVGHEHGLELLAVVKVAADTTAMHCEAGRLVPLPLPYELPTATQSEPALAEQSTLE